MLPLSEDGEIAENAAEAIPASAGEIEASTESETAATAETPAEPEKATVS